MRGYKMASHDSKWSFKVQPGHRVQNSPPPSLCCCRAPVEWVQLWLKLKQQRRGEICTKWQAARCLNRHLNNWSVRLSLWETSSFGTTAMYCMSLHVHVWCRFQQPKASFKVHKEPLSYKSVYVSFTAERLSELQRTTSKWPLTPCRRCTPWKNNEQTLFLSRLVSFSVVFHHFHTFFTIHLKKHSQTI